MTESKHTPGPWTVEEYGDDDVPSLVIHSDSSTRVCFMATPGRMGNVDTVAANAYLIAAAPELLKTARPDLLRLVADQIEGFNPEGARVLRDVASEQEAAIAKAIGSALTSGDRRDD